MPFISGGYTVTYGGSTLGQIESGIRISTPIFGERISGDSFAQAFQDGVYQGADVIISMTLLEADAAGAQSAFWFMDGTLGDLGTVGKLHTALDASLVLTAVAGTSAMWSTLTAAQALLPIGFNVDFLLAPALKRIPLQFQCGPNGSGVVFTTT